MKKGTKSFKIIVDSNIWISFLIGKNLKGLQNLIDSKANFLLSGDKDLLALNQIGETIVLNFSDFDTILK